MAGLAGSGAPTSERGSGEVSAEAGDQLRAARMQKGLSTAEIAASLKVPVRYIDALEEGDLSRLPEPAFVRGYVRSYARLVGIDPASLSVLLAPVDIRAPRQLVGIADMPAAVGRRQPASGHSLRRLVRHHRLAGLLLLVVAGGWATWTAYEPELTSLVDAARGGASSGVEVGPAAEPVLAGEVLTMPVPLPGAAEGQQSAMPADGEVSGSPGEGTASPAAVGSAEQAATMQTTAPSPGETSQVDVPRIGLYVSFRGDCWIEVRDADNIVIHHATGSAGRNLHLTGKEPLVVTLGNAGNAELWWNGEPVKVDAFSRAGVARVNLGRLTR